MEVSFSDYINDAVRILILLDSVKDRKSLKMTESKIKLYDYFLKFPCTMLGSDLENIGTKWNFDEYYAFFHWQPDLIRYRQSLNYLIAKGFIEKSLENSAIVYKINDLGIEVLNHIDNSYKSDLVDLAKNFIPKIVNHSDSKIEQLVREKSNIYLRTGGVRHEG